MLKLTLLVLFAFIVLASCKEQPKEFVKAKPKACPIVNLIIDTQLLEIDPNSFYEKGNSGEYIKDGLTGCVTYRKLTINQYWTPILNHSEIKDFDVYFYITDTYAGDIDTTGDYGFQLMVRKLLDSLKNQ